MRCQHYVKYGGGPSVAPVQRWQPYYLGHKYLVVITDSKNATNCCSILFSKCKMYNTLFLRGVTVMGEMTAQDSVHFATTAHKHKVSGLISLVVIEERYLG
jgi:hypothetical protein